MEAKMTPTVGRIVHYWPMPDDLVAGANGNQDGPVAAIITRVWTESCVNLTVFPDYALPIVRSSVLLIEAQRQPGRWSWPERV